MSGIYKIKGQGSSSRVAFLGMMFALAMALSILEYSLPAVPFLPPGVKLGLSNIVTMYCLFCLGKGSAFTVVALKSGFVFLVRGATAAFLSLCGGLSSVIVMLLMLMLKKSSPSYMIISVCGAVMHNLGQLTGAAVILKSLSTLFYLPVLVISGVGMGVVTGVLLKTVMPAITKLQNKL